MANRQNNVRHIPNDQLSQPKSLMDLPPPYEQIPPQGQNQQQYPNYPNPYPQYPNPQNHCPQYPNPRNPYQQYPNPQNPYPQYPSPSSPYHGPPPTLSPPPPPPPGDASSLPGKQPHGSDRGTSRGRGPPRGRGKRDGSNQGRGDANQGRGSANQGRGGPNRGRGGVNQERGGPNRGRGGPARGRGGGQRGQSKMNEEGDGNDSDTSVASNVSSASRDGRKRGNRRGRGRGRGRGGRGRGSNQSPGDNEESSLQDDEEEEIEDVQVAELKDNNIFHWLLKEKNGISDVRSIMSQNSLVPPGLKSEDLYHYLSECKQKFLVVRHPKDVEKSIVQVCLRNLKICVNHQAPKSCLTENCPFLHLCQAYVGGLCKRASHCSMNHSVRETQTLNILKTNVVDIFTEEEQLKIIRLSTPLVCPFEPYSKDSFCSMIHICTNFLEGKCLRLDAECPLGHTIITEHNKPILSGFGIVILEPKELSKHLMVVDQSIVPCMHSSGSEKSANQGASGKKTQPKSQKHGDDESKMKKTDSKSEKDPEDASKTKPHPKSQKHSDDAFQTKKPHPKPGKNPEDTSSTKKPHPKSGMDQPEEQKHLHKVDFEEIYQWILKTRKGSTTLLDLFKNSNLCSKLDSMEEAETLLGKSKRLLVFKNGQNSSLSTVQIYHSGVKICFKYANPAKGCDNDECRYFHLCRDYIAHNCEDHKNCIFGHDLNESHNKVLLEKYHLSDMPLKLATTVIRKSAFLTCLEHNKPDGKCPRDINKDILCPRLHICDDYIRGSCPFSAEQCAKGHTFASPQVKAWIEVHGATNLQHGVLKNMTIPSSPRNPALDLLQAISSQGSKEEAAFQDLKKEAPCEVAEESSEAAKPKSKPKKAKTPKAKEAQKAPEATPLSKWFSSMEGYKLVVDGGPASADGEMVGSQPYQWQVEYEGVWTNLDENVTIEERFMDHTCSEYWLLKVPQDVSAGGSVDRISFDDMKCNVGKIRRLSVASYCASSPSLKAEVDAEFCRTVWVWYWLDQHHNWVPYGKSGSGPYQDVLEARYQADPSSTYYFEVDDNHFFYKIDFTVMMQQNIAMGTRRKVRRRPLQPGCPIPDYMQKRHFLPQHLPSKEGWAPMDTMSPSNFALVPVESDSAARKQVEKQFFRNMDASNCTILNVARVQNIKLWKDYKRTKEEIRKSLTEAECKELSLFHGTPDLETVHCICSQSFDHRMHGRHATMYGKGAYFSISSAYSNNYTNRSSPTQHMFLAKVLVGRWTKGERDMQRPPPIGSKKHGELYNSVVDDEENPSIFVVFDNAQSYPQYLIEYQQQQPKPVRSKPKQTNVEAKTQVASNANVITPGAAIASVNPMIPPSVSGNTTPIPTPGAVAFPSPSPPLPSSPSPPPHRPCSPPQSAPPPRTQTSPKPNQAPKQEKCVVM